METPLWVTLVQSLEITKNILHTHTNIHIDAPQQKVSFIHIFLKNFCLTHFLWSTKKVT